MGVVAHGRLEIDSADPQQIPCGRGSDFVHRLIVQGVGVRRRNAEDFHLAERVLRFVAALELGRRAGRLDGGEGFQDHVRVRRSFRDGPGIAGRQGDGLAL